MEFNWSILGWIAGLIFVYVFGLYEGRGQGYKKRKAEEEQEKKDQPAPAPAAKIETAAVDDPGLLRIKNENGSFALDLDGKRVNPSSLSSDQRRRLIDMLNIMRPWLEGRSAPAPSVNTSLPPAQAPSISERLETFGGAPQSKPAPVQPERPASPSVPPAATSRNSTIAKEDR